MIVYNNELQIKFLEMSPLPEKGSEYRLMFGAYMPFEQDFYRGTEIATSLEALPNLFSVYKKGGTED